MLAIDRQDFDNALTKIMSFYNKTLEPEHKDIWWYALKDLEFARIRIAMADYAKTKTRAPSPAEIRALAEPTRIATSNIAELTHWTAQDLLCACSMAEIDWSRVSFAGRRDNFTGTWVERVAHAYDHGLADAAERIVGKHPDKSPADAARAFVTEYEKQSGKPWTLPLSDAVPM